MAGALKPTQQARPCSTAQLGPCQRLAGRFARHAPGRAGRLAAPRRAAGNGSGSSNGATSSQRETVPAGASGKPSRGVVILPGLGNSSADYARLTQLLQQRGLAVATAEVARKDWLRNAAGLRDPAYWRGTLAPRPTVDWYLHLLDAAVQDVKRATDGAPVTLLAHSAGGWLARVYLLGFGTAGIDRLVTLGSPHNPPPKESRGVDQTRGILTYVADNCPGNYHAEVSYVTVAGKCVKGAPLAGGEGVTWGQRLVGLGYAQVCGRADVWGDGVVPLPSAHLEGAKQITLDGVYHSPVGARDGAPAPEGGVVAAGRPWYGSASVLDSWLHEVVCDVSELSGARREVGEVVQEVELPEGESLPVSR